MADVIIFYDLETTDCKPWSRPKHAGVQILSIGAVNGKTGEEFLKFVLPTCEINPEAAKKNGFTKSGNELLLRGVKVDAREPEVVLQEFLDWLENQNCKYLVSQFSMEMLSRFLPI